VRETKKNKSVSNESFKHIIKVEHFIDNEDFSFKSKNECKDKVGNEVDSIS